MKDPARLRLEANALPAGSPERIRLLSERLTLLALKRDEEAALAARTEAARVELRERERRLEKAREKVDRLLRDAESGSVR